MDNIYDKITINFESACLNIYGVWSEETDAVIFRSILEFEENNSVIKAEYKQWRRAKLDNFDPDSMVTTPDFKLESIAKQFRKMGQVRTSLRMKILTSAG